MAAAQRFCSQPEGTRALVANWTAERFGRLPRLYVEATEDRSVVLAVQRKMQPDGSQPKSVHVKYLRL